ncbi:MAG: 50S ribosomal protein L29 [Cyanobacteria bacterium P01_A01_bin.68]
MEISDLLALLSDKKREHLNLRFQKKLGSLSNTAKIRLVKKHIARILTVINSKKVSKNV